MNGAVAAPPPIWTLLNSLQNLAVMPHDAVELLAALIVLRCVDFQEWEEITIADFEGTEYDSLLPHTLYWRVWCMFPPDEVENVLTKFVPAELRRLKGSPRSEAARLAPLADVLQRVRPKEGAASLMLTWLQAQPFRNSEGSPRRLRAAPRALANLGPRAPTCVVSLRGIFS